ncbi:unnamed protein product, partial [Rotaria sp. Silwood1]
MLTFPVLSTLHELTGVPVPTHEL